MSAAGCLALLLLCGAALPAPARPQDPGSLERRLVDSEARERRAAVQELAELGGDEAWRLVVRALRDPEPMVADEAQLQLGRCSSEAARDALLDDDGLGARDALVRLRAAEALGRMQVELDAQALARRLRDKDAEVRRALAWTVERQTHAGRLVLEGKGQRALGSALAKLRDKDKSVGVRAAALMAEYALDPGGAQERWKALGSKPPVELRCAKLRQCLEQFGDPVSCSAADRARAVRATEVRWLAEERTRQACQTLVELLADEPNERLAWTIAGHLQDVSGLKHGVDPRPWRRWAGELPKDWKPGARSGGPRKRAVEARSAAFVGMPVLSEQLVILVDFSGSLWEERDGRTRKERVDVELRRTLEALPESTRFNVVPYTSEPIPWKDELVPATRKNVAKALDFFEGCKASGKGNAWDALRFAFAQEGVDTVLILTDGAPTGGTRWNLELMAELLAERNRFQHVAIDAVLVDAGGLERYWRRICETSDGRALAVDL